MYVMMSATPVYNQALDSPVKVRECYTSKQLAILLISQSSVVFVHFVWFQLTMPWKLTFLEFIRSTSRTSMRCCLQQLKYMYSNLSSVISSQSLLISAILVTFRFVVTSLVFFCFVFYLSQLLFLGFFI